MKAWAARDRDGDLHLYAEKPIKRTYSFMLYGLGYMKIKRTEFPEVTFENSPQEVEIKLANK
jgi:hypothetical protein